MTYSNGFRAYEIAIISGCVSDTCYPIGAHHSETFAAKDCLWFFLSVPRSLSCAMAHLKALGFSESVARYAYRYLLDTKLVTMRAIGGVAMLSVGGTA